MRSFSKIITIILFVLISSISLFAQQQINPNNPYIQYMGRIDFSNPQQPLFAYPNVTIKANFEGTFIALLLQHHKGPVHENNYFVSIVDSKIYNKFKVSVDQKRYIIAQDLPKGKHSIEIIKVTESYCGACEFLGLELDKGKKLIAPQALPELKLEFYGNSITCGFGNEGKIQPAADNSYKAYAAVAARQLKAQFHTISYSGIGVVKGGAPFLMNQMSQKTIALKDPDLLPDNNHWDFSQYVPDIIVIALGTNDHYYGIHKGSLSYNDFVSGYINFVAQMRHRHPNAHIVCTNSPMLGVEKFDNSIKEAVQFFNTNRDDKVSYFAYQYTPCQGLYGHPNAEQGKLEGKALADYIKSLLK